MLYSPRVDMAPVNRQFLEEAPFRGLVGFDGILQSGHGSNPNRTPSEHPNPTSKRGSKMGGEFSYPKMGSHWF